MFSDLGYIKHKLKGGIKQYRTLKGQQTSLFKVLRCAKNRKRGVRNAVFIIVVLYCVKIVYRYVVVLG